MQTLARLMVVRDDMTLIGRERDWASLLCGALVPVYAAPIQPEVGWSPPRTRK